MKCTGIIAEYNPFHNGHGYHAEQARRVTGCDHIIAVMSGSFVQRGEPAMFDKYTRAAWALQNGADMVLELPTVFALSCAERFAFGAASVLAGTGLVDSLCFGSESGDVDGLSALSRLIDENGAELERAIAPELARGLSYPAALANALQRLSPAAGSLGPNDILGMEYLRALPKGMRPYAVRRVGAGHDEASGMGGYASASHIRELILCGGGYGGYMPPRTAADIQDITASGGVRSFGNLSAPIIYALRSASKERLSRLPDMSEGLENRLYAARRCAALEEALSCIKTRRYTMSRIKRALMCLLLGITADDLRLAPYIRVLGIKKEAAPLLSALSAAATLPVVTRFKDAASLPDTRLHDIDMAAYELAYMACARPSPASFDYNAPLLMV